ncbi:Os11g0229366 [Oryza sativa Japonica Group]|uniref:Os11g0229366 protein n=1 Tax=Oryza sativa subsp. japonica TaxID=39947 RepID=A0A0P0Y0B7_ORYSJ|nr:Os11g0229366 [Oryza sativa Japonica Group]
MVLYVTEGGPTYQKEENSRQKLKNFQPDQKKRRKTIRDLRVSKAPKNIQEDSVQIFELELQAARDRISPVNQNKGLLSSANPSKRRASQMMISGGREATPLSLPRLDLNFFSLRRLETKSHALSSIHTELAEETAAKVQPKFPGRSLEKRYPLPQSI